MSVIRRMRGRAPVGAAVLLCVGLIAGCGEGGPEQVPVFPGERGIPMLSAMVDADGRVALGDTGEVRSVRLKDGKAVEEKTLELPPEAVYNGGPFQFSRDLDGAAWVWDSGPNIPVRVSDGAVHPAGKTASEVMQSDDAVLAGTLADQARVIEVVAVQDPSRMLVGTDGAIAARDRRHLVAVHRLGPDGTSQLLAGRPALAPDQPTRWAADIPVGESRPATEVDLDQLVSMIALPGDDVFFTTTPRGPGARGPADFFLLSNGQLTHLDAHGARAPGNGDPITLDRLSDGRLLAELLKPQGEPEVSWTAVIVDPHTGTQTHVRDLRLDDQETHERELALLDREDRLVVVTPGALEGQTGNLITTYPDPLTSSPR